MSLSNTPPFTISHIGNGSTSTAYVVDFPFFKKEDLSVMVTSALGVVTELNVNGYSVTGGNGSAGSLKTTTAWNGTHKITISRAMVLDQPHVYAEGQRIPMKTLESSLDRIVMQVQSVWNRLGAFAAALATHVSNAANPHAVTKAQVGLGNADNTSDTDKPINNATLAALSGVARTDIANTWDAANSFGPLAVREGNQATFGGPVSLRSAVSGKLLEITSTDHSYSGNLLSINRTKEDAGNPTEEVFSVDEAGVTRTGMINAFGPVGIAHSGSSGVMLDIRSTSQDPGEDLMAICYSNEFESLFVVKQDGACSALSFTGNGANLTNLPAGSLSGTKAEFDAAASDGNFAWQGGAASFTTLDTTGNVILGNSATQTILPTARFSGPLVPNTTNSRDLGTTTLRWRDLSLSRAADIAGTLVVGGQAELSATQAATTGASAISRDLMRGSYVELAADDPLSASTTLRDINGLGLSLPAGTYELRGITNVTPQNSAMGVKINISIAGTGTIFGFNTYYNNAASQTIPYVQTSIAAFNDGRQTSGGTNAQSGVSEHNCILKVTAGTAVVKMQFAQHVSDAGTLTAKAGSYLRAVKIGN